MNFEENVSTVQFVDSVSQIMPLLDIWREYLYREEIIANQILLKKNPLFPYLIIESIEAQELKQFALDNALLNIILEPNSVANMRDSFNRYLANSSTKSNKWQLESRILLIGYPLISIKQPIKGYIPFFNIKFESIEFIGDSQIQLTQQENNLLEQKRICSIEISSYVWEIILQRPKIIYEHDFEVASMEPESQKLLFNLGISADQLKKFNIFDQNQVFELVNQALNQVEHTEIIIENKLIIQYNEKQVITRNLQNDLAAIKSADIKANNSTNKNSTSNLKSNKAKSSAQTNTENLLTEMNNAYSFVSTKGSEITGQVTGKLINYCQVGLSTSQKQVFNNVILNRLTIVKGPPGVGKTTLIRHLALYAFCNQVLNKANGITESQKIPIVISSVNNMAVDQALDSDKMWGVADELYFPPLIRLGNRQMLKSVTLPFLQKYIAKLELVDCEQINATNQLQILATEIKNSDADNFEQFTKIVNSYHFYYIVNNKKRVLSLLNKLIKEIDHDLQLFSINNDDGYFLWSIFPIVGLTMLTIRSFIELKPDKIDLLLVDESSQALIWQLFPLLYRSNKAMVIGDEYQNNIIIKVNKKQWGDICISKGVNPEIIENSYYFPTQKNPKSSFDLFVLNNITMSKLKEHFRCHNQIINFNISLCNYDLNLQSNNVVRKIKPVIDSSWWYFDVNGTEKNIGGSVSNVDEANVVVEFVKFIHPQLQGHKLVILTPYNQQQILINNLIKRAKLNIITEIVFTIHAYQGYESDIVIFSPTVCNRENSFLNNSVNLLNVAVSRARQNFIIIGSLASLAKSGYTKKLVDYAYDNGLNLQNVMTARF